MISPTTDNKSSTSEYDWKNMPFRDNKGQTPYIVAPDKDTRNVFRKFMGENPDRYDYKKAQVKRKHAACVSSNVHAVLTVVFTHLDH